MLLGRVLSLRKRPSRYVYPSLPDIREDILDSSIVSSSRGGGVVMRHHSMGPRIRVVSILAIVCGREGERGEERGRERKREEERGRERERERERGRGREGGREGGRKKGRKKREFMWEQSVMTQ